MTTDLKKRLQSATKVIFFVLLATFLVLQSNITLKELEQQKRLQEIELDRIQLQEKSFTDYMVYYKIRPIEDPVPLGSPAIWKSDFEIIRIPKNGILRIQWNEFIACDHLPFQGTGSDEEFEYYATVQYSTAEYSELKERPDPDLQKYKSGYSSKIPNTDYIIRLPKHNADCRLISTMTQFHRHEERKVFQMKSDIVRVREKITIEEE